VLFFVVGAVVLFIDSFVSLDELKVHKGVVSGISLKITKDKWRRHRSEYREVLIRVAKDSTVYIVKRVSQRVLNLVKVGDTITFYTKSGSQSDLTAVPNEILQLETADFNAATEPVLGYSGRGLRQLSLIFLAIGAVLTFSFFLNNDKMISINMR
jgi:hypothetical protein